MATTVLSKENNGLIYIYLLTTKYIRYKDEYRGSVADVDWQFSHNLYLKRTNRDKKHRFIKSVNKYLKKRYEAD